MTQDVAESDNTRFTPHVMAEIWYIYPWINSVIMTFAFSVKIGSIGAVLGLPIVGVDQLEFRCGSIIGSGRMQLPNNVTDDSIQVSKKFNNVIQNNSVPEIAQYGISTISLSGNVYSMICFTYK